MKLHSLILKAYRCFPLLDVDHFELQLDKKLIVIIGANGSGKSSLLTELIPRVSQKERFKQNGYKRLELTHNNHHYILEEYHQKDHKYFFYLDGENLNLSQNVTTQKELIESHFKLTSTISSLLTAEEQFTQLSLLSRKKLFQEITHLNIDEVLNYYNELKTLEKNKKYFIKTQHQLLLQEKLKKEKDNDYNLLNEKKKQLENYLDYLITLRAQLPSYASSSIEELSTQCEKFSTLSKTLYNRFYRLFTSYSYQDIPLYEKSLYERISSLTSEINIYYNRLEELQKKEKAFELYHKTQEKELIAELTNINKSLTQYRENLHYYSHIPSKEVYVKLKYELDLLIAKIEEIRSLPNNTIVNAKLLELMREELNSLKLNYQELSQKELQLKEEITYHESHPRQLTCPKCYNEFSDEYYVNLLKKQLEEVFTTKEKLKAQYKAKESLYIEKLNLEKSKDSFLQFYQSLMHLPYYFLDTNKVRTLIEEDNHQLVTKIKEFSLETELITIIYELTNKKAQIEKTLEEYKYISEYNEKELSSEIEDLHEILSYKYQEKNSLEVEKNQLDLVKRFYSRYEELENQLNLLKSSVDTYIAHHIEKKIKDRVDSELRVVKVELAHIQSLLENTKSIDTQIKKLEESIEKENKELEVLLFTLERLSPKEGLIAKSISSFLNLIISHINHILESIWQYKMQLEEIDVEEMSLDYRFRVKVEDKLVIEDITKVSSGMKEMIDLSFRLTLYKLLGLENYPLYLDEFGVRLDSEHRRRIKELIFRFMKSDLYSQIFLITHMDLHYLEEEDVQVVELD